MHPIHPLQLPEILSKIAAYIPRRSALACVRVCKSWHQAFNGRVWEEINLNGFVHPAVLQKYAHLVKVAKLDEVVVQAEDFVFPNAHSLTFSVARCLIYEDLVAQNTNVTWLKIVAGISCRFGVTTHRGLWSRIQCGLVHLKELEIENISIASADIDTFWNVCTRLESLAIKFDFDMPNPQFWSNELVRFPHIRKLKFNGYSDEGAVSAVEIMLRCPALTLFEWTLHDLEAHRLGWFLRLLAAKTWPHLDTLLFPARPLDPESLGKILRAAPQITGLSFQPHETENIELSRSVLGLLRPHFDRLRYIDLKGSQAYTPTICPIAQDILSSCPALETFISTQIDAVTILQGRPWVCLKLQVLILDIIFESNSSLPDPDSQPRILDQLARLTQLRELSLCLYHRYEYDLSPSPLRLQDGLDKLSTLRSLERIQWGIMQRIEEPEYRWILEHWTSLKSMEGARNISHNLKKAFREWGIDVV
ncbi:hypothetical protein B0O80DRAFT_463851 [Mortierella sp. GBAus27b]|nr:hypothetical protein BGX31_010398 [Mortierella sp. GBA43]KAI8348158.1 hypothetical protein B0O80DRAFT_463851 [Mortierella sp. GBAus27b]